MGIAAIAVAAPFVYRIYGGAWPHWSAVRLAFLGGVLFAADLAAWATGVMLSGATNPTLLANTAPLWVGLGALVLFKQHLRRGFWFGTVLAIVGAALVLGLEREGPSLGSLLGLVAAVFYAGYFLVTQVGREKLDSLSYFWLATVSSAAVLLMLSRGLSLPLTGYAPVSYLSFLALGLVTQVLGYFAVSFALGYLPASVVAPTLLGQPVITALLAVPLLGETLGLAQLLGGASVLAGVFMANRSQDPLA